MISKLPDTITMHHEFNGEFEVKEERALNNREIIHKINEIIDNINYIPELKIRYHKEMFPELKEVEQHGNFIDLCTAEDIKLKTGEFKLINLGVSVECPDGYWLEIVPRSSTFKKYGIMEANSIGVIDTDYCGDNDILHFPAYATRECEIPANTRICQFRLVRDIPFSINTVEKLDNNDRGGFGSSDNK